MGRCSSVANLVHWHVPAPAGEVHLLPPLAAGPVPSHILPDQRAGASVLASIGQRRTSRLHSERSPAATARPAGRAEADRTLCRWHRAPAAEKGTTPRRAEPVVTAFWLGRRSAGSFSPRSVWRPASSRAENSSHTNARHDTIHPVAGTPALLSGDHGLRPGALLPHFSARALHWSRFS